MKRSYKTGSAHCPRAHHFDRVDGFRRRHLTIAAIKKTLTSWLCRNCRASGPIGRSGKAKEQKSVTMAVVSRKPSRGARCGATIVSAVAKAVPAVASSLRPLPPRWSRNKAGMIAKAAGGAAPSQAGGRSFLQSARNAGFLLPSSRSEHRRRLPWPAGNSGCVSRPFRREICF